METLIPRYLEEIIKSIGMSELIPFSPKKREVIGNLYIFKNDDGLELHAPRY